MFLRCMIKKMIKTKTKKEKMKERKKEKEKRKIVVWLIPPCEKTHPISYFGVIEHPLHDVYFSDEN